MGKTYHNLKASRARREGVHHVPDACTNDLCLHCGKAKRGGRSKRERAALLDGLDRALQSNRPNQYLDLLDTWEAIDYAYPYEPADPTTETD